VIQCRQKFDQPIGIIWTNAVVGVGPLLVYVYSSLGGVAKLSYVSQKQVVPTLLASSRPPDGSQSLHSRAVADRKWGEGAFPVIPLSLIAFIS
jgi:hypothetical protein